jgi:hypothetical protein
MTAISIAMQDFLFLVLNPTFSNISAISWRTVLVMEEAGIPGETDHGQATGKLWFPLPIKLVGTILLKYW